LPVLGKTATDPAFEATALVASPAHHGPTVSGRRHNLGRVKRIHLLHPSLRIRALSVLIGTSKLAAVCLMLFVFA
jgi:hypothetical protein